MNSLRCFFNLACFSVAFGMSMYWIYKFSKDEDLTNVDFKPLTSSLSEGEFPMISICFRNPFIASKLKEYDASLAQDDYVQILKGERPYNGSRKIDFEDVSIDLAKFYLADAIWFRNGTTIDGFHPNLLNMLPRATWAGFFGTWFMKCFGLTVNFSNVAYAEYHFNSSLLFRGIQTEPIIIFPHLPNKCFVKGDIEAKVILKNRIKDTEYEFHALLNRIEIVKRRNKISDPCITDDLNYDQTVLSSHLSKIGCKAPYQYTNKSWKICNAPEDIKAANIDAILRNDILNACKSAETFTFTYEEEKVNDRGSDWFHITVVFPDRVKEIEMVKAIDIHTVIGNVGGYIGLFLGNH